MDSQRQAQDTAGAAWEAMRRERIPPTPRNFQIWFAYHSKDKPALRERIDLLARKPAAFTPGVLDRLHRDFFAANINVAAVAEDSRELRDIATRMVGQVTADRGMIDEVGTALSDWNPILDAAAGDNPGHAIQVLHEMTAEAGGRLRALEQILTASIIRIGELNQKLAQSEREASLDVLTGLANRRLFDATLAREAARAAEEGVPLSMLMLDIDNFKKFNDTHGHQMGDNVLRLVGQVLMNHIKGRDTAARHGGEEFAIILFGAAPPAAATVGEQIRELLERRPLVNRSTGEKLGFVTCSIGVATLRRREAVGDLVDRADRALYRAKRAGRNRVVCDEG